VLAACEGCGGGGEGGAAAVAGSICRVGSLAAAGWSGLGAGAAPV